MPLTDMQYVHRRQTEWPWTAYYEVGLREALPVAHELPLPMEQLVRRLRTDGTPGTVAQELVTMTERRELYSSANGDTWFFASSRLARCLSCTSRICRRGARPQKSASEFLARGAIGPEHRALVDLIGTLVRGHPAERSVRTA
jgi:hypothetical protein